MNAHRQLGVKEETAAKDQENRSSCLHINRADDEVAGLTKHACPSSLIWASEMALH
ncbi:hypothetical protein [Shouchella patagoniensis]|uniref:hypothetical protein n=1 Tax=Shouchella patagoniensis TaxID=228576 RepID=UPI001474381F|nr:hypothetical protein [Shouchella patagoniensis]